MVVVFVVDVVIVVVLKNTVFSEMNSTMTNSTDSEGSGKK